MKKVAFWSVQTILVVAATLAGAEIIASHYAPSWPNLMVRPIMVKAGRAKARAGVDKSKYVEPVYNSWGFRDYERSIGRPANVRFRSLLVGDSFLEGGFVKAPVSMLVENIWAASGHDGMEAINFGIAATDPPQYYYRIKKVGLRLKPDVVLVMFYSGNDFVSEPIESHLIPPLISELPEPSILGSVAPKLTWVIVDRLQLSEFASGQSPFPAEFVTLNALVQKPRSERLDSLSRYLKQHYFPKLSEKTIREILSRGTEEFWSAFKPMSMDRQYLEGWILKNLIGAEIGTGPVPMSAAEADRAVDMSMVKATLSWLVAMRHLVEAHQEKFVVAMAPVGVVDPVYVNYWRVWQRAFSFWLQADARHRKLANLLEQQGFNVVDLRAELDGVPGTYRVSDAHWNEHGHEIVAARLAKELLKLSQQ